MSIRFPPDLHARLIKEADARDLPANYLAVKAIEEFLDRLIPADEWKLTR